MISFIIYWTSAIAASFKEKKARRVLFILLGIDLLFFPVHYIHVFTTYLQPEFFNLKTDLGMAESFGYLKWIWCALLVFKISKLQRSKVYYGWIIIFIYILLDDSLRGHERLGWHINSYLENFTLMGMKTQAFGELLALLFSGGTICILVAIMFYYGNEICRKFSIGLIILFFILGFFVIILDAVHTMNSSDPTYDFWMGLLENGGEMLVSSIIAAYIYGFYYYLMKLKNI